MEFGICVDGRDDVEQLVRLARSADEHGYQYVLVNDVYFDRSPFPLLGAFSRETRRVKLGTNVTNPFIRHPVDLASQIATVHELSGGRGFLGISSGSPRAFDPIATTARRPATACREAIEIIKRLHRGEVVTHHGRIFKTDRARLTFDVQGDIPVFHAAAGPKMIQVAAQAADGLIIGLGPLAFDRHVIETYRSELAKAGRDPKGAEIVKNIIVSASEDREHALRHARELSLAHIARKIDEAPATLAMIDGIDGERAGRIVASLRDCLGDHRRLARIITDDIMRQFVIVGTPDECIADIRSRAEMGITHIQLLRPSVASIEAMAGVVREL